MAEKLFIKRRKSRHSETSFDSLRHQAIKLIEQVSGRQWTDYNLHDPGITILEQLIYAITDLIYRCDFEVEDYLANEDGNIDFSNLALHSPAEAFSCRATTELDYRKLLLNHVPQADNVWLAPMDNESALRGLYRVSVKLAQGLDAAARDTAIKQLREAYHSARNLGEDIGEIIIVENLEYELCANIEISSGCRPSELLAEIYFECAHLLANSVSVTTYDELSGQDLNFETLFDGPFTDHGLFSDEALRARPGGDFIVSTLFNTINTIEGVDHIQQLYLQKDQQSFFDMIESNGVDKALSLLLPQSREQFKVVLTTNGRVMDIDVQEFGAKYDELNYIYQRSRSTKQLLSLLYTPPHGTARHMAQYYSIQNQFPANYGINALGVPDSAPVEVKAKARQLKSYLLIFEQLLSNFHANIDALPALFSLQTEPRKSYAVQPLTAKQINDLQALYPEEPFEVFSQIIERFDNYDNRKSRLLDYLLALYGERFSQNSLRHFNYYYSRHEIESVIIDNKVAWLKSIIELGRDRAAAPDYSAAASCDEAHSGLARRLRLLLGFESANSQSLTMAILGQGFKLCRHQDYEPLTAGTQALTFIKESFFPGGFEAATLEAPVDSSLQGLRETLAQALVYSFLLKNQLISDALLRDGIYIDRYRIGCLPPMQEYQLALRIGAEQYWYLGSFADRKSAISAANQLRQFLIQLNKQSEGLHIIEHILLRPSGDKEKVAELTNSGDFYSMQLSVIFPAWSARCRDARFRMLAEETLRLNLPAHLYAHVYWLEFDAMSEFETLYANWRDLKRDALAAHADIDQSAQRLIAFLQAHKEAGSDDG